MRGPRSRREATPRGLRGRSREKHLLGRVRDRVGDHPTVIEMGAGVSRTVAGLWPTGPRYVATDISLPALQAGRRMLDPRTASVQCDAVTWPFRESSADVVLILGVLHHLSDWRAALERACRTVRPGGFLLLHEAVMPHNWTPLAVLAMSSQVVGQGLLIYSLKNFTPLVIGLALLTQPAVSALTGWVAFGEVLSLGDVAGMVLLAGALAMAKAGDKPA